MKPKTTIFLIAVLLVCVAFVTVRKAGWFDRQDKADDSDVKGAKLFADAPDKPVSLSVKNAAGAEMVFRKVGDDWRLVQPVDAPADKYRVEQIADMFGELKIQRLIKGDDEEAASDVTGLDAPRWTVTLKGADESTHTLTIGRDLPRIGSAQTAAYVHASGQDETCVVAEDFAQTLRRPVGDFRSKMVLDLDTDRIVSVTVSGNESYRLAKRDGKWGIERPVSALTDEEKVKDLLWKFSNLTADEFVADAPESFAPYGLDKPSLVVNIEVEPAKVDSEGTSKATSAPVEPNKRYSLALGRKVGKKIFARLTNEKSVFKLNESMLKDLQPRLLDLRDKSVLPLKADSVAGVELLMPSGKAVLTRLGGVWMMVSPMNGLASSEAISKLIEGVSSLKADDFVDSPGAVMSSGLASPRGRITLRLAGKGKEVSLLIGSESPSGEKTFVMASGGTSVAVVSTSSVEGLLVTPANFWSPTLLELDSESGEKVTSLSVTSGKVTTALASDKEGKWRLVAPVKAVADKANLDLLLDRLDKLTATTVVALGRKEVPAKYAAAAKVVLAFTTQTPPAAPATSQPASAPKPKPTVKKYRLHVAKLNGSAYAWVPGAKIVAVGQFASDLYDVMAAELRDRAVWSITPADVSRVIIASPKGSVELRREGEKWIYVADSLVAIDSDKVSSYLDAVKELQADRFVSHKASDAAKYSLDAPATNVKLTVDGKVMQITVSPRGPKKSASRYAVVMGVDGVFLLAADKLGDLAKTLDDFKK